MVARKNECLFYQKTEEGPEMAECAQAETITDIKETLKTVAQAVNRIAVQDERMLAFDRKNVEQDIDINGLYDRMRTIENVLGVNGDGIRMKVVDAFVPFKEQIDRLEKLLNIVTSRVFVTIILSLFGIIVVGCICDLAYHSDLLNMLFNWLTKLWSKVPR